MGLAVTAIKASFEFDEDAFIRTIEKVTHEALQDRVRETETLMKSLQLRLRGRNLELIRSELLRELDAIGASVSEPELTQYATAIRDGVSIAVRAA